MFVANILDIMLLVYLLQAMNGVCTINHMTYACYRTLWCKRVSKPSGGN